MMNALNHRSQLIGVLLLVASVLALLLTVSQLAAQAVLHLSIAVLALLLLIELRRNTQATKAAADQAAAAAEKAAAVQVTADEVHTLVNLQHAEMETLVATLTDGVNESRSNDEDQRPA